MHSTVINSFSYIFIAINEYVAELQFCRLCTLTDATDVIFQQTITFACLYKLLSWAKVKKQSLMSSAGNTGGLPSDLTGIVHACIQKIHTFGASGRSVSALQLKVPLSAFCSLNRSVTRALSSGNANCCLLAQCLYVSSSSSSQCKTATERKCLTSLEWSGQRLHSAPVYWRLHYCSRTHCKQTKRATTSSTFV